MHGDVELNEHLVLILCSVPIAISVDKYVPLVYIYH